MHRSDGAAPKLRYERPALRAHGDIHSLTRGGSRSGEKDQWWTFFGRTDQTFSN